MASTRSSNKPGLPVELISRIFSLILSKDTLRNACLCSHEYYDIVSPRLYERIELRRRDSDSDVFEDLRPLTSLFLRKPKLAAYVKYLSLRPAFDERPITGRDGAEPEPTLELDADWTRAIRALSPSEDQAQAWIKAARYEEGEDAVLVLLLSTLERLETLDLEIGISPKVFEQAMLRIGRREPPFDHQKVLRSLKDIALFNTDNEYGGHVVAGTFMLPSVERMYLHRIGSYDDTPDEDVNAIPPKQSPLKHLELKDCRLSDSDMTAILAAPKALETFICNVGWGHFSYTSVSFPVIRHGLENHKGSLGSLWLDYGHDGIEWLEDMDDTSPLAFSEFSQLKHLRLATVFIFGEEWEDEGDDYKRLANALPGSVVGLHLTHCEEDAGILCRALGHMLQCGRFGCLEAVTVEISKQCTAKLVDAVQDTIKLARDLGISVKILNNHAEGQWKDYDKRIERKWGMHEDVEFPECSSYCNQRPLYEELDIEKSSDDVAKGIITIDEVEETDGDAVADSDDEPQDETID